jgi:hypothetical protein
MQVFIDGQQFSQTIDEAATLESNVQSIREQLDQRRMIVEIVCDGIDLVDGDLQEGLAQPAKKYKRVDIKTGTPEELVTLALSQGQCILTESESLRSTAVEKLSAGKVEEAMTALGECIAKWRSVHDALDKSIQMLDIDATSHTIGDRPLTEVILEPQNLLEEIKSTLLNKDFVQLADILEYEFETVINNWQSILKSVSDIAETRLAHSPSSPI